METIHVSDVEAARDLLSLLAKVRAGTTVMIEKDAQVIAILRPLEPKPLSLRERLALLPEDASAVMDEEFAHDVEKAIAHHREPSNSAAWE